MRQRLIDAKKWLTTKHSSWQVTPFWKNIVAATIKFAINFWSAFLYISLILAGYYVTSLIYGSDVKFLRIFKIKDVAQFSIAVVVIRFLWSVIRNR
jgi:hypothetical protein